MPIYALGDIEPQIHPDAWVAPEAVLIGAVFLGPEATVWPHAVLRGDDNEIRIGARTSVQDGCVLHVTAELPTIVGEECVIGHNVHLEGCTVADRSLIGSGAVVLHEAVIGPDGLVGANAVVTNRFVVPPGAMALGVPAKLRGEADTEEIRRGMQTYLDRRRRYLSELRRIG
jgi:carbonic anhydrase/acetyltransferase-like protein (isoleucine patch superfamily)